QIADSTVNLVLGQIREATTPVQENTTWASQPGAIRTFSGKLATAKATLKLSTVSDASYYPYNPGSEDYVYRLYSAEKLKTKTGEYTSSELPAEVEVINKWDRTNPIAGYVDMNEPFLDQRTDISEGGAIVEPHYPIIDPRAKYTDSENENNSPSPGIVDGFDAKITTDPKLRLLNENGGAGAAVPYIPMPVKWLYVLKDGSIGGANRGTAGNPIVGRTAFWTDDESSKLNINTASEGTFWDTPSVSNEQECGTVESNGLYRVNTKSLGLAAAQPVRGEYQRYSGHPFTTSLSPVLGWLWGIKPTTDIYPSVAAYVKYKEAIYQITPFTPWADPDKKYKDTTTKGGTFNADKNSDVAPILSLTRKHLYANVDEMIFKSQRTTGGANGKSLQNEIVTGGAKITPKALEKVRFFLTASSRAPDINLFGRPRVTLWPIAEDFKKRTNYDDLFAFSSTIYKNPDNNASQDKRFFLTRSDAKSDVKDFVPQNKSMYDYLQAVTSGNIAEVPGFGGSFLKKYGPDRDQILTEIFDYSRSVNLVDTGTATKSANKFYPYTPRFYKTGYTEGYGRLARSVDWSGQVTPLKIGPAGADTSTAGMGRFIMISEAALIFHRPALPGGVAATPAGLQAILAFEMASPMAGFPAIRETYWTEVIEERPMLIKFAKAGSKDANMCKTKMINICNLPSHEISQGRGFMPVLGFHASMHYFLENKGMTNTDLSQDPALDTARNLSLTVGIKTFDNKNASSTSYVKDQTVKYYPYVSDIFPVDPTDTNLVFSGPAFKVNIYSGESPADTRSVLVQTVHLDFPSAPDVRVPMPLPTSGKDASFGLRFDGTLDGARDIINTRGAQDVVRSIEFTGPLAGNKRGDLRLGMARSVLGPEYYQMRDGPSTTTGYFSANRLIHGLTSSHGDIQAGNTGAGVFARGGNNRDSKRPMLPKDVTGVERADGGPGDWDRGISKHMDGAMGNKVDEGNIRFELTNGTPSYRVPYFHGRNIEDTGQSFYTPNRQMPSVAMIGSLPTGVKANKPWQTLLFRPDREAAFTHPGSQGPPDHLMLDLFHLPVVEPYAISEPFSTAGKVNMNYVIAPFGYAAGDSGNLPGTNKGRSYLRRDSALRGVLKSTFMMAVPTAVSEAGHSEDALNNPSASLTFRYPLDLDKTIEEFEARLNDQGTNISSRQTTLFRSPSEVCEMDLYPKGVNVPSWNSFWTANAQTGDNMRERPYVHIYPRLTTKSNVYTVHMRCQAIRKSPGSKDNEFDPKRDQVLGEYRGSSVIERFIDPNDETLSRYDEKKERVDGYYRYRVVSSKQFAPH
ncbi:MAG: hypothetical protein JWL90_1517, partial [Chthoniobacteraceae bacterium]|nr:hypothetical protein [Chthoniobacteraceae bacterium]